MPDDSRTPQQKFEDYNPYAANASKAIGELTPAELAALDATLAVAFEISRLRAEIKFGGNGRRSS